MKKESGFIELIIIGAVAVLALGGTGAVMLSRNAVPGDTLFPVKQFVENTQLKAAVGSKSKAAVELNIAKSDINEIKTEQKHNASLTKVEDSLDSLEKNELEAQKDIKQAQSKGDDVGELENQLESERAEAKEVLEALEVKVPEPAQKGIQQALSVIEKSGTVSDRGKSKGKSSQTIDSSGKTETESESSGSTGSTTESEHSGSGSVTNSESTSGSSSGSGYGGSGSSGSGSSGSGSGGSGSDDGGTDSGHGGGH